MLDVLPADAEPGPSALYLTRALAVNPSLIEAYLELARLSRPAGQRPRAGNLSQSHRNGEKDPRAYIQAAAAYKDSKDYATLRACCARRRRLLERPGHSQTACFYRRPEFGEQLAGGTKTKMIPYRVTKNDEAMIVRRGKFLTLVQTAMNKRELQFVRQACLIGWQATPAICW
jgi:hypothetical protein